MKDRKKYGGYTMNTPIIHTRYQAAHSRGISARAGKCGRPPSCCDELRGAS